MNQAATQDTILKVASALQKSGKKKSPTKKKSKKGKSKKNKSFWSKAVKFASGAAPVMLPLALSLLAKGSSGSRSLGALSSSIPTGMAVGLNNGIAPQLASPGILSQIEKRDAFGKVFSSTITGREELGTLTIPVNALAGDVVFSVDLTPLSGVLAGTRLALQASGFARFRFNACAMSVVSSLAATTGGQLAMCILTDPQQTIPSSGGGPSITRLISDSAGSDVFQVWSNGICSYPGTINVDPYYTNPLASGSEYLTSAGQGVIVAMTDATAELSVGTVFLDYEIEFLQPTLESFATITKWASIQGGSGASSCTDAYPLGLAIPPSIVSDNIGITGLSGDGFYLPPGSWLITWVIGPSSGTVVSGFTAFSAAISASFPGSGIYMSSNGSACSPQVIIIDLVVTSATTGNKFSVATALTGVTGDTISSNQMYVYTDPTTFPTLLSSRNRINRINTEAAAFSRAQLALERERDLEDRLRRLEISSSTQPLRR